MGIVLVLVLVLVLEIRRAATVEMEIVKFICRSTRQGFEDEDENEDEDEDEEENASWHSKCR